MHKTSIKRRFQLLTIASHNRVFGQTWLNTYHTTRNQRTIKSKIQRRENIVVPNAIGGSDIVTSSIGRRDSVVFGTCCQRPKSINLLKHTQLSIIHTRPASTVIDTGPRRGRPRNTVARDATRNLSGRTPSLSNFSNPSRQDTIGLCWTPWNASTPTNLAVSRVTV